MKILFVNTHYYMPQSFRGLSRTLHQLCLSLKDRGHQVAVLSGFHRAGTFGLSRSLAMKFGMMTHGTKIARDLKLGYPVWRSWQPVDDLLRVCAREQPDILVIKGGQIVPVARVARDAGVPLLMHVHDVELNFHGGDFGEVADLPCVANSQFTASFYETRFGISSTVVYPFVSPEKYRVESTRETVTFVNPYLHKGLRVALGVAQACPDLPFTFVGKVPATDPDGQPLAELIEKLPNVTVMPPQSDMRAAYGQARILLAPSQWEEAFGRVAVEAEISGIPVLGSAQGGLPEAIGDGGILLDASAPVDAWVRALRRLWEDKDFYAEMRDRALAAAARPELKLDHQLAAHEAAMADAIARWTSECPLPAAMNGTA